MESGSNEAGGFFPSGQRFCRAQSIKGTRTKVMTIFTARKQTQTRPHVVSTWAREIKLTH
jgi:hypothetical protein